MAVEYFEDEGGQHRYRVKAANGEPLVTSEGYTRREDAERGFEALKRAIAATVFSTEWPHGVQRLTMPYALTSDEPGGELTPESDPVNRVEDGPVRFGDDWTGLWLRGDTCFAYALALRAMKADKTDAFAIAGVDGLITALESTNEAKAAADTGS